MSAPELVLITSTLLSPVLVDLPARHGKLGHPSTTAVWRLPPDGGISSGSRRAQDGDRRATTAVVAQANTADGCWAARAGGAGARAALRWRRGAGTCDIEAGKSSVRRR